LFWVSFPPGGRAELYAGTSDKFAISFGPDYLEAGTNSQAFDAEGKRNI
jgi:hypothetical protein